MQIMQHQDSQKTYIYRCTDKYGCGMYGSPDACDLDLDLFRAYSQIHPCPEEDGINHVSPYEYFGFISIKQAKQWLSNRDIEILESKEFKLRIFECNTEDVRVGARQAVFIKANAKEVACFDIIALHGENIDDVERRIVNEINSRYY